MGYYYYYHWKGWGGASVIHLEENREFSGQMFFCVPLGRRR